MSTLRPLSSLMIALLLGAGAAPSPLRAMDAVKEEVRADEAEKKGFVGRVFTIRHVSSNRLAGALSPLLSSKAATLSWTDLDGVNTLSVRDYPQNVAAIQEALATLDVPSRVRPSLEITASVLFAFRQELASQELPSALRPVVEALRNTMNFKGFSLATSFQVRSTDHGGISVEGGPDVELPGKAKAEALPRSVTMTLAIQSLALQEGEGGDSAMELGHLAFRVLDPNTGSRLGMLTTERILLRAGEKVVVGTTALKDKAIILVLSGRVLK